MPYILMILAGMALMWLGAIIGGMVYAVAAVLLGPDAALWCLCIYVCVALLWIAVKWP